MEHRHLLSDEFDLLVDGEEGFGVAPLTAHLASCATCRAELTSRRGVVSALEHLPHHSPSPLFAYHVMQHVRVFEPWYVPLVEAAKRFMPRSRPIRVLAGATAGVIGVTVTMAASWLLMRLDVAAFLVSIASERLRTSADAFFGATLTAIFGDAAIGAAKTVGASGAAIVLLAFGFTVLGAALSLRAVTAAAYRRRA